MRVLFQVWVWCLFVQTNLSTLLRSRWVNQFNHWFLFLKCVVSSSPLVVFLFQNSMISDFERSLSLSILPGPQFHRIPCLWAPRMISTQSTPLFQSTPLCRCIKGAGVRESPLPTVLPAHYLPTRDALWAEIVWKKRRIRFIEICVFFP